MRSTLQCRILFDSSIARKGFDMFYLSAHFNEILTWNLISKSTCDNRATKRNWIIASETSIFYFENKNRKIPNSPSHNNIKPRKSAFLNINIMEMYGRCGTLSKNSDEHRTTKKKVETHEMDWMLNGITSSPFTFYSFFVFLDFFRSFLHISRLQQQPNASS